MASLLGIPACVPADLSHDRKGNENGVWESASLVQFNDRLLGSAAGAWWCPPTPGHDWAADADDGGEEARSAFRAAHRGPYWIWKDPRNCLTLAFWLRALAVRPPVLLMLRNPLDISASLTARNQFSKMAGLALWERYLREAIQALAGLPVLASRYEDMVGDPRSWCARTAEFLADAGNPVELTTALLAANYVRTDPRRVSRNRRTLDSDPDVSAEQRRLAVLLETVVGAHHRFPAAPEIGPETPTTELFFAEQRAAHRLGNQPVNRLARQPSAISLFAPLARRKRNQAPEASVIVITRDEGQWLAYTIRRLSATVPAGTEIIVVDDGSTDRCADAVASHPDVRIVRPAERLGIARARNYGARLARGSLLVFSDAHVDPRPGWLPALVDALSKPGAGAANPVLADLANPQSTVNGLVFDGANLNVRWLVEPDRHEPFPVPMLAGCFLAIRRDVFGATGEFDEGMTGYGAEDLELCMRLWRMGYRCLSVPAALVAHRFRPPRDRKIDQVGFLHNLLRMATVHMGHERLQEIILTLHRQPEFAAALARVLANDVGTRRAEIEALCWNDDQWFFRRFGPACYA
jgi:GT2 family glycosyltransferase